jgi:hypothetical protein
MPRSAAVRFQAEATNLEMSASYHYRPQISSYASRVVPQGYTSEGQVIGAAIGPGSSSQWLAADYVAGSWQAGLVGGRVRENNTAFYKLTEPTRYAHDVSVFGGLRASYVRGRVGATVEYLEGERINYLFQTFLTLETVRSVNIHNRSLKLLVSLTPR